MNKRKIKQPGRARVKPAFTRLKELPVEKRLATLEIVESQTYKDAQPLVQQLVGFACSINVLCKFRAWQTTEQDLARDADLVEQIEKFLRTRKGDWSVERIQEAAISFLMMQALSKGDIKGFTAITRLPALLDQVRLKAERLELDREKFAESQQSKISAGLDAVAEEFSRNPEALKLYQVARDVLEGHPPKIEPPKPKPPPVEEKKEEEDKRVYLTRLIYRRKGCGCVCRTCHPDNGEYPYAEAVQDAAEAKQRGALSFWRGLTMINTNPQECACPCACGQSTVPNPQRKSEETNGMNANGPNVEPPESNTPSPQPKTQPSNLITIGSEKSEPAAIAAYRARELSDFQRRAALWKTKAGSAELHSA